VSRSAELAERRQLLFSLKLSRSFLAFVIHYWSVVTGGPLDPNRAITEACAVLQRLGTGELRRVLIAMPSGVGKSTLLVLYKAWRLARQPAHRTIAMMHSAALANTESLRLRRLVESDEYRAMFPAVQLRADEQRVDSWATTRDGRHYSVGVDSSLLGRRAKELICDDPLDVLQRFSPAAKLSLWAWFSESAMSRLDGDDATVLVVHQRLCIDDLIGRLLEQRDADGNPAWHLLELPAETDDGTLLAPAILSREKLDELKQRNPRAYAAMFLQRPSADDGAAIARTAWRFHTPASGNPNAQRPLGCTKPDESPTLETPSSFTAQVISVDPTFGSLKGDYCSITVWGAVGSQRFLLDRWCKKAKQLEQRAQVKAFRAKYPRATVLVESAAGGAGMLEELEAEGITNIEGVTVGSTSGNKMARLENVSPGIERGEVLLGLGVPGLADFVECLAGATRWDDDADSTSQALHWLNVNSATVDHRARWNAINKGVAAMASHLAGRRSKPLTFSFDSPQVHPDRASPAAAAAHMRLLLKRESLGLPLTQSQTKAIAKHRAKHPEAKP
jgi:predicted phage terminase large subunit-like protein